MAYNSKRYYRMEPRKPGHFSVVKLHMRRLRRFLQEEQREFIEHQERLDRRFSRCVRDRADVIAQDRVNNIEIELRRKAEEEHKKREQAHDARMAELRQELHERTKAKQRELDYKLQHVKELGREEMDRAKQALAMDYNERMDRHYKTMDATVSQLTAIIKRAKVELMEVVRQQGELTPNSITDLVREIALEGF